MDEFKFTCPHCGQPIRCRRVHAGRQVLCPGCQHLIRIPPPPDASLSGQPAPEEGQTWASFPPLPLPPKPPKD